MKKKARPVFRSPPTVNGYSSGAAIDAATCLPASSKPNGGLMFQSAAGTAAEQIW